MQFKVKLALNTSNICGYFLAGTSNDGQAFAPNQESESSGVHLDIVNIPASEEATFTEPSEDTRTSDRNLPSTSIPAAINITVQEDNQSVPEAPLPVLPGNLSQLQFYSL